MVNNFCMRFNWFSLFPFSGTEISFQIYWRIRGWSFSCRSKISGYSIQTTVNCLCREDFWFDSWQFEERIISAVELMYLKKKMQTYTKYAISSCSQRKLTCPTLLINPEDPAERWVLVVRKPLDLKFLCRRHRSAEALDSQYGKVRFSSPTWNNFDTKVNKFLEASRRDEL